MKQIGRGSGTGGARELWYSAGMTAKLEKVFTAISALPAQAQDAIAEGLVEELETYTTSQLSAEQLDIVVDRLSRPLTLVSREVVDQTFRRYKRPA